MARINNKYLNDFEFVLWFLQGAKPALSGTICRIPASLRKPSMLSEACAT